MNMRSPSLATLLICLFAESSFAQSNDALTSTFNGCYHDANQDGIVDASDLLSFLAVFGESCAVTGSQPLEHLAAVVPEPYADGMACTGQNPKNLFIFDEDADFQYNFVAASFTTFDDGSALLSASCVDQSQPNAGYLLELHLIDRMNWDEWSQQDFPSSYRDDCGFVGTLYQEWDYYRVSSQSTLTGWGLNADHAFSVIHMPANFYYGFQVGEGASNVNLNQGGGGWLLVSGEVNGESTNRAANLYFDLWPTNP